MKKLKVFFSVLIVITLLAGLFWNSQKGGKGIETTEFLFDTICSITVFSRDDQVAAKDAFDEAARIHKLSELDSYIRMKIIRFGVFGRIVQILEIG